jgi:hypothetical protein
MSRTILFLPLFFILLSASLSSAQTESFPPFYIRKVNMGEQLVPFNLIDLDGKTWSNRSYLRKPMLIITGSWALRHDLRKWADFLSMNYILQIDILWVFNPCSTIFADHRKRAEEAFAGFKTSVPVAVDVHSYIGRSLKINYDIPTIIGISRSNRFMFSLESPLNKPAREKIARLIESRL